MRNKVRRRVWAVILVFLPTIVCAASAKTIYVDADATGANDGTSWADAYKYPADALEDANSSDKPVEILVAQGLYKPDRGVGITPGDRTATFQLINGVNLKGGYAGLGELDPNARDADTYETILSGDLNGDDGPSFGNNSDNSYHVVTGSGTDATAVLDGFAITCGNADGNNPAWKYGGGGGVYSYYGSPTILNCRISGNSGRSGGGVKNYYGRPNIINCVISSNRATECCGGGVGNYTSDPNIVNCTFSNNIAQSGSAIYNSNSSPNLTNCIVWGNKAESAVVPSRWQIYQVSSSDPVISYSCVQDDDPNDNYVYPGTGNIDDNPLFVEPDGADNVVGTEDEQLRLLRGSPCLDAGDNSAVPPSVVTDLDGDPRIANGTVDMGAYEGPDQGFLLSAESIAIPEGQTATFTLALSLDPCGTVNATVAVVSGDRDITVASGALLSFNSGGYHIPQTIMLAAAQDADYFNGCALIQITCPGFSTAGVTANEWDDEAPVVLYVDYDAPVGANNGTSWHDAFTDLQDALSVARVVVQVKEIHVAQGLYKPAGPGGQRDISFDLVDGVSVTGGYAGFGELDPDARDIEAYETILSGDLNGDDVQVADACDLFNEPTRAENSWHVVAAPRGTGETTILDGFTIAGGNANGGGYPLYEYNGGGVDVYYDCNPTVRNCTFIGNSADNDGGGVNGDAMLTDCQFIANAAEYGGGVFSGGTLTDCEFIGNFAEHGGGLIAHGKAVNCTFIGNSASTWGGAMSGDAELTDCTFSVNSAGQAGGALLGCGTLTNCIFSGNSAGEIGGAMYSYCYSCEGKVINCTFTGNSAGEYGGAMFLGDESDRQLLNCILWANTAPEGPQIAVDAVYAYGLAISYCNIQGGITDIYGHSDVQWGDGNIDADPCLADLGYWDPNGTPEDANDDFWVDGDYHLRSLAGRWEPSAQSWVQDDVTSPCIDAGDPMAPIGPEPFPNGGIINMGAYGGTAQGSKSYFGKPVCETIVAGDINGDCEVNFKDFVFMGLHWMEDNNP